jgi:hypothetical protein
VYAIFALKHDKEAALPDYSEIDNMKEHETGAVRSKDVDHLALSLLPSDALKAISAVLKEGQKKYSAHNWRKGFKYSDTYNHLMAHLLNWNESGDLEELTHAGCNILFLLEFEVKKAKYKAMGKDLDDRFNFEEDIKSDFKFGPEGKAGEALAVGKDGNLLWKKPSQG